MFDDANEKKMNKRTRPDEAKEMSTRAFVLWLIGGGLVILALGSTPLLIALNYLEENTVPNDAGLIGDSFGLINALVSGLAFIGLIVTLRMQKQELKLQREELRETREQFQRSADAQEKTEEQLQRQVDLMYVSSYLNLLEIQMQGESVEGHARSSTGIWAIDFGDSESKVHSKVIMKRLRRSFETALARISVPLHEFIEGRISSLYVLLASDFNSIRTMLDSSVRKESLLSQVKIFIRRCRAAREEIIDFRRTINPNDTPAEFEALHSIENLLVAILETWVEPNEKEETVNYIRDYVNEMRGAISSIKKELANLRNYFHDNPHS